ncbi:hypothetical protein LWM68_39625 [Niabella sp. W65]|nr:hypothetical protein [Niabella sp. W65]MCH7368310.1 hypothetical protein [Niabella sp. W65]
MVQTDRLKALLKRLLDENEFLSGGGIRALSKYHEAHPYSVTINGEVHSIQYDPGDSTSDMFGAIPTGGALFGYLSTLSLYSLSGV